MFHGILAGIDSLVPEATLSHPPAQSDGAVSVSPHGPQAGTYKNFYAGLHDLS